MTAWSRKSGLSTNFVSTGKKKVTSTLRLSKVMVQSVEVIGNMVEHDCEPLCLPVSKYVQSVIDLEHYPTTWWQHVENSMRFNVGKAC